MTKHAYLPTTLISDKGSAFVFHVIEEVAGDLAIILEHATTKHAQTIGLLEGSHASIKQALKQASEVYCGLNTPALRSLNTILLITQALDVTQVNFFMDVFL